MQFVTVFVKGDMLVVIPFLLLVSLVGLWSVRFMLLIYAVYFTFRSIGEMHFWFHQQFYDFKYRPFDFGLKDLDNKAIYILYQVLSMNLAVIGASAVLYILFFMK
jgi:hypothetical protein